MKRVFIISLFVLLVVVAAAIWNFSYQESYEEAKVDSESLNESVVIDSEEGVFRRSKYAIEYSKMPIDLKHQRKLKDYYKNRAFYGAPPTIPHEVSSSTIGSNACLKCHENGGFVNKYSSYAPITPHPKKINCMQCHVEVRTESQFVSSNWKSNVAPDLGNAALVGSPPTIPHQIQMRENCLSCHAGPSAVAELRTTHPERINCRQCHVVNNKKIADIGTFARINK